MWRSTVRMWGGIFIIVSMLSFLASIISPDFVSSHLSEDHSLKPGTLLVIQNARRPALIFGILTAVAALPLLIRPRLARFEKELVIYIVILAAVLFFLVLGNPTQDDYLVTSYISRLSIEHWNIYEYVLLDSELPAEYACYPPCYYIIQAFWLSLMGKIGLVDLASWTEPAYSFRTAFFGKVPILIAIFLTALFLWKLLPSSKRALGLGLFLFSPALIESVVLQGQFDVILGCLVIAGLLVSRKALLQNSFNTAQSLAAVLLVGLSGCFKHYGLLLVPVFAISLARKNLLRVLVLAASGFLPFVLSFVPYALGSRMGAGLVSEILSSAPSGRLLDMKIISQTNSIPVFLLGYFLLLFFLFESRQRDDFKSLHIASWAVMSWFFVTVYFHPQWFVWLCPVAVIGAVCSRRFLVWYIFQMILFSAYTLKWCNVVNKALNQYTAGLIPCLRTLPNYDIISAVLIALFASVTLYIPIAFYRSHRIESLRKGL